MKKPLFKLTTIFAMLCLLLSASCANDTKKGDANKSTTTTAAKSMLPNYRYVDLDTILNKYNLAKDYSEQMLSMQSNLENTARQKENAIQSYANGVQQKYQNNSYLTQADQEALQNAQQRLQNMQNSAQNELAKLQQDYQNAAMQAQQTINDSIENFIKEYNKSHGYDAILNKAATLYINPDLDITDEIVEGLNARYNKVKKK